MEEGGEDFIYMGIKILEAQEEERKRLSRDIHDGPAQSIANIVLKAEICKTLMQRDIQQGLLELEGLKESVRMTLKDIRKIIYDLRPMSIDDLGIIPTLRRFAHEFTERTGIKVQVETTKINADVEKIIEIAIFRLTQEIFNNIEHHSKATSVFLNLSFGTKYLKLEIKDNGVGFDFDQTLETARLEQTSFGLVGIVERVDQLHGTIAYDSKVGNGTRVTVTIPINREVMKDELQGHKNTDS
jgi:two-component system sensor histidine kinase DegS